MDDVEPLLVYWSDNPPSHLILAAVHLKKRRKRGAQETLPNGSTEQELLSSGVMKINRKKKNA
jgi:hypothetical protein